MRTSKEYQKSNINIDLPAQNVWKELQENFTENTSSPHELDSGKSSIKIEQLLDQAFKLLLDQLSRQS